ncbi:MAG: amino-acid N-acetyltransferase [Gammaproteobacteria bacterium]|nr:amino-acid N-acetyltransferase [Gammaproteobacteria bacterium]
MSMSRPRLSTEHVSWLRDAAGYFDAHRGKTVVVHFDGELLLEGGLRSLARDLALLQSVGMGLVLVYGARAQISAAMATAGIETTLHGDLRITPREAVSCCLSACTAVQADIEAALSEVASHNPHERVIVVSGNFVVARPHGIHAGVDYQRSGDVRRVAAQAIRPLLEAGQMVLLGPMATTPSGEWLNLRSERVAARVAAALQADKLVFLGSEEGFTHPESGAMLRQLDIPRGELLLAVSRAHRGDVPQPSTGNPARDETLRKLAVALEACRDGVARAHFLDRRRDGALLLELFSRDGVGSMLTADTYDTIRAASADDLGGLRALIEPLEANGVLIPRTIEQLEADIGQFLVVERDQSIIGCAALYCFSDPPSAELACLAIDPRYQKAERGDALLAAVETRAVDAGAHFLFALSTQTVDWFRERGFVERGPDALPTERAARYDRQRGSKVLVKSLQAPPG